MKSIFYTIVTLNIFLFGISNAQNSSEIHRTLKANDSLLFERSFNNCETQYLDVLISEDLEFYHDISGTTNSKEAFIKIMKNGICNPNNNTKSRRELVEGSLETFPLKKNNIVYGALQNGVHKFFETTNGNETAASIAKFSHLWILNNGQWHLKRVISFDHKKQSQPEIKTVSINHSLLDSYAGTYKGSHSGIIKVSKIENGLHIHTDNFKTDVYPKTETLFFHKQMPLTFEFISDPDGNVIKFIVKENNKIVEEVLKQ